MTNYRNVQAANEKHTNRPNCENRAILQHLLQRGHIDKAHRYTNMLRHFSPSCKLKQRSEDVYASCGRPHSGKAAVGSYGGANNNPEQKAADDGDYHGNLVTLQAQKYC